MRAGTAACPVPAFLRPAGDFYETSIGVSVATARGKSTFFNAVASLLPVRAGTITLSGSDSRGSPLTSA